MPGGTIAMIIEDYVKKHWKHQTDAQMGNLFRLSKDTIARMRSKMGLVRTSTANRDLYRLTPKERKDWYKGRFDPHETDWIFSGLTR